MKKLFKQRAEFNDRFEISHRDTFGIIPEDDYELEVLMMNEETSEYRDACIDKDPIEIADAICDELYLVIGKAYKHGLDAETTERIMDEIHRSNMSKLHDGKVVKDEYGKISSAVHQTILKILNELKTTEHPDFKVWDRFRSKTLPDQLEKFYRDVDKTHR